MNATNLVGYRTVVVAATLTTLAVAVSACAGASTSSTARPHQRKLEMPTLVQLGNGTAGALPAAAIEQQVPEATSINPPFDGLDETFSGGAPNGSPSDTSVAANGSKVLQAVNRSLRITNTSGGLAQTMSLEQFFGALAGNGPTFDPKVYFDRNAVNQRFYALALQQKGFDNNDPVDDFSAIHLAISRSSNPADLNPASWCHYELSGFYTSPATNNLMTHADFPGLGVGADSLVITTNQHLNDAFGMFAVSVVRPLNKLIYSNNAGSCPLDGYWEIEASGTFNDFSAHTLQPAQHYTSPTSFPGKANPVYLVSSLHFGISSTYRVWRIANVAPVSDTTPPVLESVAVSWSTYSNAPPAPGGAGGAKVDVGSARILQVAGLGNAISAVHTIACQFTANTPLESCFRMVRFVVGQANGTMTVTKSELQGLGGGDNTFYYHPSIAVNNSNQTAVVFLASLPGNAHRISSKVATKALGGGFGVSTTLTNGTCARAAFMAGLNVSTGDYTGAQTAVDGNAFWVAAEHADLIGGACRWKTRIARITHQ